MEFAVTIQAVAGRRFLARSGEPIAASAEASTRDEALLRLQGLIRERLESGVEVVALEIGGGPDAAKSDENAVTAHADRLRNLATWHRLGADGSAVLPRSLTVESEDGGGGDWKESPLFEEWRESMLAYRREAESRPDPF